MKHYTLLIEALLVITSSITIIQLIQIHDLKIEVAAKAISQKEWKKAYRRVLSKLNPDQMIDELAIAVDMMKFTEIIKNL